MLKNVHHINLLVRDLDAAVAQYRSVLGIDRFEREALPGRGALTARFRIGDTWIVLVQPVDPEGVPGRHLAQHGEGLFLLSLGVDSLDAAREGVVAGGGAVDGAGPRGGLDGWRVLDLDPGCLAGAPLQFTEDREDG